MDATPRCPRFGTSDNRRKRSWAHLAAGSGTIVRLFCFQSRMRPYAGHGCTSWILARRARGGGSLILNADKDRKEGRGHDTSKAGDKVTSEKARSGKKKDVGSALRTAYQRVVNEEIPPDLIDLLGKLG